MTPDTEVALSSPGSTVDGLAAALSKSDVEWGSPSAVNLPAVTTTPREMVETLRRLTDNSVAGLVKWQRDQAVERIVGSWSSRVTAERSRVLGLEPGAGIEAIVRQYVTDHGLVLVSKATP